MTTAERYEHAGVSVAIYYDADASNPRTEWDNFGTMVCWHTRYDLGDEQVNEYQRDTYASIEELVASYGTRLVLPLGLYDHSGITMYVGSGPAVGDSAGWDSGQVGFIFVTAEQIREEFGCKRITQKIIDKAEAILRQEVETYDEYLTGQVYGFVVDEGGEYEDSLWGIYGLDYAKTEANEIAESVAMNKATDFIPEAPVGETIALLA